ncbi:MAG: hypothetical protein JXA25_12910 [Anaerolineales bacterium]|nr:hypothetical protein [Anaerolineales bacterium]
MQKNIWILGFVFLAVYLPACRAAEEENSSGSEQISQVSGIETPQALPTDFEPVRLAWFYKPPSNSNLDTLVDSYDFFILTRLDERERDEILQSGNKADMLQYLLFTEIMDPGSCTQQPWHNQVAEIIGDFCEIEANHSDWFLRGVTGGLLKNENNFVLMDPANQEWRDFWLERAKRSQEANGWRGVFLDNVEASLRKRYLTGLIPASYPTDAAYQAAVEDNLRYLYRSYFQPSGIPLYANIISLTDPSVWYRYIQYLDGAMIENFAVGWSRGDGTLAEWEMQLNIAEGTQAMGKDIILVSQGEPLDHERETFALASYLLINNGRAYFRYTHQSSYDLHWWYDNYEVDPGLPLKSRYKSGDEWIRDFTNGRVIVNPNTFQATIEVGLP